MTTTLTLWRLFHRGGLRTQTHTSALAIVAFAAATGIFLTVLSGVHGFIYRASPDHTVRCFVDHTACATLHADPQFAEMGGFYVSLALFACVLLFVPFTALAGSAARLVASRRDARMAALRLAGASNRQVIRLMALDAAGQSLAGALLGIVIYLVAMPAIMLLRFQGARFTFQELWVGPIVLAATVLGVVLLALVSSLLTLRRVAITPLGVMQRTATAQPGKWRVVVFVVVMALAIVALYVLKKVAPSGVLSTAVVYGIIFGLIGGCFALLNLLGVWVVSARARAKVRKPKDAATLIAMRRILDNPRRAWRNVSGIALAVFVAGITSSSAYFGQASDAPANAQSWIDTDIVTGGLLTLVFAAILAAVSCGVMQAGNVYDQVAEYRMLMLEGTDAKTMDRARTLEVLTPLKTVVVVSAGCSMLLMLPLLGNVLTEPTTLLSFFGGIALCFILVLFGTFAANRVADGLSLRQYRADD